jgi:hypothetical protein
LPGPVQNQNFSGVHPILGKTFFNGYPTDYTGTRFISQVSQTPQLGVQVIPQPGSPGGPVTPGSGGPLNKAGFSGVGAAILLLLGAGLVFGGKKKGSRVTGPKAGKGALMLVGLGIGGFLLYKHFNSPAEKRIKLMAYAAAIADANRRALWQGKLPLLSDDEINDLYNYLYSYEIPISQGQPVGISSALLTANINLYTKYGIPDFSDSMNLALNAGGQLPAAVPVKQILPTSGGGGTVLSNNPDNSQMPGDAFVPSPYMPPLGTGVQVVQPSIYDLYTDNQHSFSTGMQMDEFSTAV